jgi:hypothetical protein
MATETALLEYLTYHTNNNIIITKNKTVVKSNRVGNEYPLHIDYVSASLLPKNPT